MILNFSSKGNNCFTAYGPPAPITVKVKLPLHLFKHRIMGVYRESEGMAPCILKLNSECCNNLKLSNVFCPIVIELNHLRVDSETLKL